MTDILPQAIKVLPMQQQQVAESPKLIKSPRAGWGSPYAQERIVGPVFTSPEAYVADYKRESYEGS